MQDHHWRTKPPYFSAEVVLYTRIILKIQTVSNSIPLWIIRYSNIFSSVLFPIKQAGADITFCAVWLKAFTAYHRKIHDASPVTAHAGLVESVIVPCRHQ